MPHLHPPQAIETKEKKAKLCFSVVSTVNQEVVKAQRSTSLKSSPEQAKFCEVKLETSKPTPRRRQIRSKRDKMHDLSLYRGCVFL